jgi:hypothetical protein
MLFSKYLSAGYFINVIVDIFLSNINQKEKNECLENVINNKIENIAGSV